MWKAFVQWLFSPDDNTADVPSGTGLRLFWLVVFFLALWWSLIGGILVLWGRV